MKKTSDPSDNTILVEGILEVMHCGFRKIIFRKNETEDSKKAYKVIEKEFSGDNISFTTYEYEVCKGWLAKAFKRTAERGDATYLKYSDGDTEGTNDETEILN
jgi:hypothetical protein